MQRLLWAEVSPASSGSNTLPGFAESCIKPGWWHVVEVEGGSGWASPRNCCHQPCRDRFFCISASTCALFKRKRMGGRVKAMKGLNLFHSIPKTSVKEENNTLARRGQSCQLFFFPLQSCRSSQNLGEKKRFFAYANSTLTGHVCPLVKGGGTCKIPTLDSKTQFSRCRLVKTGLRTAGLEKGLRLQVFAIS